MSSNQDDIARPIDTLSIVKQLEAVGHTREQAEAYARILYTVASGNYANKSDIERLNDKLHNISLGLSRIESKLNNIK